MHPNDLGPIYTETLAGIASGAFPVEPWNTWTNLVFVGLLLHIAFRTRLNRRRYPLIVISLPIVAIGIIGGTLYHATRSHPAWYFMDFVPIAILMSAAALSFWREIVRTWPRAVLLFLLVALSGRMLGFALATEQTNRISLGYLSAALSILFPLMVIVRRKHWEGLGLLCGVILAFISALTCRMLDRPGTESPLPMGTHFLWHVFGGVAVWMLMLLMIRLHDSSGDSRRDPDLSRPPPVNRARDAGVSETRTTPRRAGHQLQRQVVERRTSSSVFSTLSVLCTLFVSIPLSREQSDLQL